MIVRYVRERKDDKKLQNFHLTLNQCYICLGIIFYGDSSIAPQIIILSDPRYIPCSFDLDCFDCVDPHIPDGWKFLGDSRGFCRLYPKEIDDDFWDKLEEGNEVSQVILDAIIRKIERFHNIKIEDINKIQKVENLFKPEDPCGWPFQYK